VAHREWRRWRLSDRVQSLRSLAGEIEINQKALDRKMSIFPTLALNHAEDPNEGAERLVRWFAGSRDWADSLQRGSGKVAVSREDVLAQVRELSDYGIVLEDELDALLAKAYPDLSEDVRRRSFLVAATVTALPFGYLFFRNREVNKIVSLAQRMLNWQSPLRFSDVYEGFRRYGAARNFGALPPRPVLDAVIKSLSEFRSDEQFVYRIGDPVREKETIISWLLGQLDEEPDGVLHRNEILGRAVAAKHKQATINQYLQFAPEISALGRNCFAIIGRPVEREAIEDHQRLGLLLSSTTQIVSTNDLGERFELDLVVGTEMQNGGSMTISRNLANRLKGRTLRISTGVQLFGHIGVSNLTMFGFLTALQSLDVVTGDEIRVEINFSMGSALISRTDRRTR
jgi:hypothetical protein